MVLSGPKFHIAQLFSITIGSNTTANDIDGNPSPSLTRILNSKVDPETRRSIIEQPSEMRGSAAPLEPRVLTFFVGNRSLRCSQPLHQFFLRRRCSDSFVAVEATHPTHYGSRCSITFNNLLQICSNTRTFAQAQQVHQQIIHHGLEWDPFVTTKLVQLYADLDLIVYAQKLFGKLSRPNVFAWTAMLSFHLRSGMFVECLQLYGQMRLEGVAPDNYVFPKIIRACAQLSCSRMGGLFHKEVIVWGSEFSLLVSNSLIDMYSKCKDAAAAGRVFDIMEERDLLSWNSLISCYVSNGVSVSAFKLMRHMRQVGVEPDLVTWNCLLDAYCRIGMCDEALEVFAQIMEPNLITWTVLISGFSRIGKHELSLGVFRDMMSRLVVFPDVDSLSVAIVSCRHLGALRNGQEIHGYGVKLHSRCAFYSSAGPALVAMYTRCGRFDIASEVFDLMDKSDVVTWNAMIFGLVDLEMGHSALGCFREMQSIGIKNDQTTLSTTLPVCELKSGKEIHAHVIRCSFDTTIPVLNALISMYSKRGCIKTAELIFSNMVTRDAVSWNTMVGGYAMHGQGQSAIACVQEMKSLGLSVNSVTLTSALSACSHGGLVDEGLQLVHSMSREFGIAPKVEHFTCLVDMLARSGRLDDAVDVLNQIPLKADKRMWGAILTASEAQQNLGVAKLAVENLTKLEPENAGHYVTLYNLYARCGRWDDAVSIRKMMENRGSIKPLGTSWNTSENTSMLDQWMP